MVTDTNRPSKTVPYHEIRNRHVRLLKQLLEHTAEDEEAALRWAISQLAGLPEHWIAQSPSETNDTAALTELAAALRPIIERDEQRGMPTTGLESAAREIEWAARRDRPPGSNEHPMTLGRLLLETARGSVKERIVTGKELAEIRANMARYFKGPLHFREPLDESGAPYIYDANGNAVAMLIWPGHPVEETAAAEQATYALGHAMAAVVDGDAVKANEQS